MSGTNRSVTRRAMRAALLLGSSALDLTVRGAHKAAAQQVARDLRVSRSGAYRLIADYASVTGSTLPSVTKPAGQGSAATC